MSPSPCLPTGQAETLPPMPELKKLSSLRRRRKLPSQGPNQAGKERCVPCVDIQSSASGQMATYLSTDAHETTPTLTVHHRNRTEQAMHTKASYMQQRIPPVRSQDSLNFTGYFSPSGYTTDHLSSQHTFPSTQQGNQPTHTVPHGNHTEQAMHTKASNMQQRIPPARSQDSLDFTGCFSSSDHLSSQHTFPSTQQEKQQRFDPSRNVSSQHNEWRRQMQLQQSQVPHPRHRNAQHSYGQDYRSNLHAHYPNYSQYFGNAGYQAHVEGRKESHQPRLPHQMDPFSRQGMQRLPQDPMQMYRQNGPGLQYQYQNQVNREENQRQYQSQMQVYKQQNQDHNQINRMHQYHMQMHQQNGQKQYRLDLHYNARHQVQMGEKHRKAHTEEHPVNMKACREQNQYQNYIKHCQTQFSQSKTQQVHRAEEDKELPQQTNQLLHNQQGVGGSLEQCWQAIHRQLHFQNLTLERGKANESSPKDNANVAGSPKSDVTPPEENTHSPPNLLNGNPQSQMDSPSGETDENHTQHHPQTSHDIVSSPSSVSEDLEQTTMVGGHTLISAETFLSYLKTSAAEEDNGGKTHTPVSAPHSSYRVNIKTGASIRFIDLLDESEDGEDATVSPRRSSTSTDHEKEMNYFDDSENNAHLGSSSPVYKQVDRNSDSENSFTDNMQREMVREIYTEVTELDGSFQLTNVLKPSEGIPTLVGCDTPHYSDPTRLEYREIETGRCKKPRK
ncbi:putative uncharacterized protein DDB_G0282133 [Penaeus monodon]|uniref:putative uncharacterized protein DDB_G0282133 n=1 Tax=Penaeus monodon TaxID=6687 RepID=UPI0018A7D7FD|nr:putative uncharacterized protein DDB_G0282133 [Penaeus monodon]XP_037804210.1 putative uncharacterized protein DDB_G0282133 [Penaeus monodon]